jgi:hypothetical protein
VTTGPRKPPAEESKATTWLSPTQYRQSLGPNLNPRGRLKSSEGSGTKTRTSCPRGSVIRGSPLNGPISSPSLSKLSQRLAVHRGSDKVPCEGSVPPSRSVGACAWLAQVLFELASGLDPELAERLAEVVVNCAGTDEQLRGDFLVGGTVSREA